MPIALIVGEYNRDDPIVNTFRETARRLGYDIEEAGYQAASRILIEPREQHLVLFCISITIRAPSELLKMLRPCGRRTIVYVHTSSASAEEAIRYSHEGLADGYVVGSDGPVTEESIEGFCNLVRKLHARRPLHDRIAFQWRNGVCPMAFISTAFDRNNRTVMERAVTPALDKLGFTVEWGNGDYRRTVYDQIRDTIKRSSIFIANVNLDDRNLVHNPNVYFEAGIAASRKSRPIVFVRRADQKNVQLPADILGRPWLTYENEIDLAQKLYHGLKPDGA